MLAVHVTECSLFSLLLFGSLCVRVVFQAYASVNVTSVTSAALPDHSISDLPLHVTIESCSSTSPTGAIWRSACCVWITFLSACSHTLLLPPITCRWQKQKPALKSVPWKNKHQKSPSLIILWLASLLSLSLLLPFFHSLSRSYFSAVAFLSVYLLMLLFIAVPFSTVSLSVKKRLFSKRRLLQPPSSEKLQMTHSALPGWITPLLNTH